MLRVATDEQKESRVATILRITALKLTYPRRDFEMISGE